MSRQTAANEWAHSAARTRYLREVPKKIRPDFDLHAVGLREAWERGEREQFLVRTSSPRSATRRARASVSSAEIDLPAGERFPDLELQNTPLSADAL
jgi:hypothetical protein